MNVDEWIDWSKSENNDSASTYNGPSRSQRVFNVSATYGANGYGIGVNYNININTMRKATPGGNGTLLLRDCTLSEAIVRYPFDVDGDVLTLRPMPWATNITVQKLGRDYEATGMGSKQSLITNTASALLTLTDTPSTLGGIWLAVSSRYRAQANLSHVGGWNTIDILDGDTVSSTYLRAETMDDMIIQDDNITWADPTDDIISMAYGLMLRTAIAATHERPYTDEYHPLTGTQPEIRWPDLSSVNRTLDQQAVLSRSYTETIYQTQAGWVIAAFLVVALACISIVHTFWSWWNLGRPVTMSPIEIAKAFDAPTLRSADPNGSIDEHLQAIGDLKVCYGFGTDTIAADKCSDTELQRLRSTDHDSLETHRQALQKAIPALTGEGLGAQPQQLVPAQLVETFDHPSTVSANTSGVDGSEATTGLTSSAHSDATDDGATPRASVDVDNPQRAETDTEVAAVRYRLMFRRVGNID